MRLLILLAVTLSYWSHASYAAPPEAAPFFREGDVVALVGGEDMVVAAELGYLEALIQRALPAHKLKFRSLAWEGDTVFEQPRQVNYPTLEAQLDDIGATVVICQFGQMESLAGKDKLPEFIAAYEKLLGRLGGGGKRRMILVPPNINMDDVDQSVVDDVTVPGLILPRLRDQTGSPSGEAALATDRIALREKSARVYGKAVEALGESHRVIGHELAGNSRPWTRQTRTDGLHLDRMGHTMFTVPFGASVVLEMSHKGPPEEQATRYQNLGKEMINFDLEALTALVAEKNRLWYHYYRPQNWAFLAGDRTNQPSSRDHLDLSKRWFPEEMKQWLPLIEAKEKEIWALAAKLAQEEK